MKVYVIRHAQAEDFGQRPLTEKAVKQAEAVGLHFKDMQERPEIVLTSSVLRASQTAERLCEAGEMDSPHVVDWLRCGMQPHTAMSELKAYEGFERVAIVGHNPDLYFLLHHVLEERDAPAHVKKSSVTLLEDFDPNAGRAKLGEIQLF